MTYDELKDEVCAAVPMNNRDKAGAAINRAAKRIAYTIPFAVKTGTLTFATSKAVYDFSSDFTITDLGRVLSINRNDSVRTPVLELLEPETIIGLTASGYTGLTRSYSIEGDDEVRFYPWPIVNNSLTMVYVQAYTNMSAGSDTPDTWIDPQFQDAITFLAASRLCVREDIQKVRYFKDLYREEMDDYSFWMKRRQGGSLSRIIVGYPGNFSQPPHDPSTYLRGA